MAQTVIQRTFAGGELAPALHARADLVKYVSGLRTCRNFLIQRSGGVANRPGTRLVAECKTNSTAVKLIRYVSETIGESILIEVGNGYLRFFKNGAAVELAGVAAYNGATDYVIGDICVSDGVNYYCRQDTGGGIAPPNAAYWYAMPGALLELPSPFGTSLCHHAQSGNVITLTSGAGVVAPHELIFVATTVWVIRQVSTAPTILPPTGPILTPGGAGTLTYAYKVTAGALESYEESEPSIVAQAANVSEPTPAAPHVLQWTAAVGAAEYYVYCDPYGNGTFGFIGTATGILSFRDVGFTPDFAVTPPLARILFTTAGNYPKRATYYQQRRFFGNTILNPDSIWGSRTGFHSNFGVSSPLQDDDALTFKIAGAQHNPIRHLIGLKQLVVLTDAGEWSVGEPRIPLTPSSLEADQETYFGVADVTPVVIGNAILYVQSRGAILRDLRFDYTVEGLGGKDLSLFASHLFDGYSLDDVAYQQTPHSIVWCCRSDGTLLGLTYLREEEVWGWHRHDTGAAGMFQHVCVVPEAGEDVVYLIVRRTIGGVYHRFIEKLERREIFTFISDAFFVDSGLSWDGAPVTVIGGIGHLEGQVLAVLADGAVLYNGDPAGGNAPLFRVVGGSVTLPAPVAPATGYSVIHAGLPIRFAEIETLDLDVAGSDVRAKRKRLPALNILVDATSRSFYAGPDATSLYQYKLTPQEGTSQVLPFTGQLEMSVIARFDNEGRILIRQQDPLPVSILGVLPPVEVGG
jgi:hypothetical protein